MHNANPVLGMAFLVYRTFRGELPNFLPGRAPDFLGSCFVCQEGGGSGSRELLTGSARFSSAGTTCSCCTSCTEVSQEQAHSECQATTIFS